MFYICEYNYCRIEGGYDVARELYSYYKSVMLPEAIFWHYFDGGLALYVFLILSQQKIFN